MWDGHSLDEVWGENRFFVIIEGLGIDTQKVFKNLFMICTSPRKGTGMDKTIYCLEAGKCES